MTIARKFFSTLLAAALAATPALAQAPAAALTKIGAAAAVQGVIKAQAPNAVGRIINSGKPLYLNDHVTTDAAGHMQILLLDETVFTIGPSSDMVLDEFVYDPNTSAGKVSASIVKGTFRFVTGKVARKDPDQMRVKLAVGTIGIRGSVAVGETGPNGSTVINGGAGPSNDGGESSAGIFVSNNGQNTDLTRPGSGTTILPGQGPSGAQDMGGKLNALMSGLSSKPGSGGAGGNGGGQASVGSGPIGDASGKNTASGGALANNASSDTGLADAANTTTNNAIQQAAAAGVADGLATWDQLRTLNQGQTYWFEGDTATVGCSGPACFSATPIASFQLQVDFSARTLGGTGVFNPTSSSNQSFIHAHNVFSNGDTVQQLINTISFASLAGNATVTLNGTNMQPTTGLPFGGSGNYNGSTFSLQNAGGVVAKNAVINMTFAGQNSFSQAANLSGTYTAPRP